MSKNQLILDVVNINRLNITNNYLYIIRKLSLIASVY